eukprot:TRINITY_DN31262_c0_g1_i1.p1 TRINITY_DN31262_c0_g1~~TRINITY_DN31262_c0_g1_i1.p1  ORF type:complete len:127 (-),score=23.89 TRINITY_DN31262_c0_g1_i1:67-447(-)
MVSKLSCLPCMAGSPSPNAITVNVTSTSGSGDATLLLFLHDRMLADAPAALAAKATVQVQEGKVARAVLDPDLSVKQVGKSYKEMINPVFYVSLDCDKSTLTYEDSPVFGLNIGQTAQLQVKARGR